MSAASLRLPLALAAVLPALAGCPLPQPLAEFPEGQTITPPRITAVTPGETYVLVPAGCGGAGPPYDLAATLFDQNTLEPVEARWFVDYRPAGLRAAIQRRSDVVASDVQNDFFRTVPPWTGFRPYDYEPAAELFPGAANDAAGVTRVVELVVSNGFAADGTTVPLPNRSPAPGFETQAHRWVFVNVPPSAELPCP